MLPWLLQGFHEKHAAVYLKQAFVELLAAQREHFQRQITVLQVVQSSLVDVVTRT